MAINLRVIFVATAILMMAGFTGCVNVVPGGGGDDGDPAAFTTADAGRGGAMYDKWWTIVGADGPTEDHPLWATRPDMDSNGRTGGDTWRCKECHGWDYKGVDGAYGGGSHRTGFAGVFGTAASPQEAFDTIKTDHGFGAAGLSDDDIWDLAKFVLEGQIDTDEILDAQGAFSGVADDGAVPFGTNCAACHGADGLSVPPGGDADFDAFVGVLSNDNPWEFQHKVRFGQPGTAMPALAGTLSLQGLADLGAFSQALPTAAEPDGFVNANATRGGALYDKWWVVASLEAPTDDHPLWASRPDMDSNGRTGGDTWRCKECHGWDYKGVDGAYGGGSHRTGFAGIFGTDRTAQEVFDLLTDADSHAFPSAGLADSDIWDLAKFVLEGQIDTDTILDAFGAFTGGAADGQPLYGTACSACHGVDGLSVPPGGDADFDAFVGVLSNDNPWEFQHKLRFGQPGTAMPPQVSVLTLEEVNDLSAFSQTLPTGP